MLPGRGVGWANGAVGFHCLGESSMPEFVGRCKMMQDGEPLSHGDTILNHSLIKDSLPILRLGGHSGNAVNYDWVSMPWIASLSLSLCKSAGWSSPS